MIKKLKLVNSGKIHGEAKIISETEGILDNGGDVQGGVVELESLIHKKTAFFNCQALTVKAGVIEGLVTAQTQIILAGNIEGEGTLKSNNILKCADGLITDMSIQCRLEAKDIKFTTSHGLKLASFVGEIAQIKAKYLEIPKALVGNDRLVVTLKKLSVDVDPEQTISINVPLSVTDAQLRLNAKQVILGSVHSPLGLKLSSERVFLNGDMDEATAKNLNLQCLKDLHIAGNFVAPSLSFTPQVETLEVEQSGRLEVQQFIPTAKALMIHGKINAGGVQFERANCVIASGSATQKAIITSKGLLNLFSIASVELNNVELFSTKQIALGTNGKEIQKLKIGKDVRVISDDKLAVRVSDFDVDESGGIANRQGNVFQGKEVTLITADGDMHYRFLRMGLRTLEGGVLSVVANGEITLPPFEDGGFSFHHGHFKAKRVSLSKSTWFGGTRTLMGDLTVEFQDDSPKVASADSYESPTIPFNIESKTVILGKLKVITPESRVIVDPGATLDIRKGFQVNSLRNRGTIISTGGQNYADQRFINHGKATLGNLDVWNFESSQREWGRPNFKITGDLKIQRHFAMYGSDGCVQGSIIFHQGNSTNDWSGYSGNFRLCPVNPGGGRPWLTTRQEPSPIDATKMDTFPVLRGDGRGSRLVVTNNIHSPEGKKLEELQIIASELIVQGGYLELDVQDASNIMNLCGISTRYTHTSTSYSWFLMFEWNHRRHYDYTNSQYQCPEFKTRIRANDFRLSVKGSRFDLKEKKPEVIGDPTQPDALVLRGADVAGFKIRVVKGSVLEQVTPLRLTGEVVFSEDGTPTIEIHGLELSQAIVDRMGRMGVSPQNIAAAYVGVPRFVITQVAGNAPRGPLGAQGLSPAAMFHVHSEMTNAAGIPFVHQDARSSGEDFAKTMLNSGEAGLVAARNRRGEQWFALEIKDIETAKQALQAFMSLVQHNEQQPQLTEAPNASDIAKLEQMLDESELMREFKADVKEIMGLHHELISVPEAQRIVKARQGVVNKLSRDGFESLELTPSEMQQFLSEGDRFYTERVFIEGRWVDLARVSLSEATRRYWGSDFKGLKVRKNLHLTSQKGSALLGCIEAEQDLIVTVHNGDLELGPQDEHTISIIGGRRRTILHVKKGRLLLYPGVILLGQQVILMADNGISLSPVVIETWWTRRQWIFLIKDTTTTWKEISYKERLTLDDGSRGIIIYSKNGDVNVSGAHIGNENSPVVLLAAGDVLMGPLLTDTYYHKDDRVLLCRDITTHRGQTAKATKVSNIPNAVTLDKVLARPDILEAVLADILGASKERHRRLLLTDKDAIALRQGSVLIRAMGEVKGSAVNLATAFAEICAGKAITLTAVDTVHETHSEGWSINFFNGIGSAICSLFDTQTKEALKDTAQLEEEKRERAIAERMGAFTAIFYAMIEHMVMDGVQKALAAMPQGELETWVNRRQQGHPDQMPQKLWNVIRPFAGVVTSNGSSLVESIVTFARVSQQHHDLAGVGAVMAVTQGVIEGFRFVDALKSIEAKGFQNFLKNGFEELAKDMYSIGFSFYESYTKKKVQMPGQINALFSLKLRTNGLLNISGTYVRSFMGDWQAKESE